MFDGESKEKKEELKRHFRRLGQIINDTLTHSEKIQEVLSQIRGFGLGVDISIVIGLGLYCHPDGSQNNLEPEPSLEGKIKFELTSQDRFFLDHYKLRLSIENDTETSTNHEAFEDEET